MGDKQEMFLFHINVSLYIYVSPASSLKSINISLGEDFRKTKKTQEVFRILRESA